jgi:hypothetical protein
VSRYTHPTRQKKKKGPVSLCLLNQTVERYIVRVSFGSIKPGGNKNLPEREKLSQVVDGKADDLPYQDRIA